MTKIKRDFANCLIHSQDDFSSSLNVRNFEFIGDPLRVSICPIWASLGDVSSVWMQYQLGNVLYFDDHSILPRQLLPVCSKTS